MSPTPRGNRVQHRGQSGFVVITSLAVWMLVGGAVMIALLGMTVSVTVQARQQAEDAQRIRALDGALETAVVEIQIDPSGKVGQPSGKADGECAAPLGSGKGDLVVDDGLGAAVVVTTQCWPGAAKGEPTTVLLHARLDEDSRSQGSATLAVSKAKGPGNDVAVLSWSVGPGVSSSPTTTSTTSPTSTTSTTTTSTSTTTSTTVPANGIRADLRVTSEWQSGYCVEVTVTNTNRNTEKWSVQVPVKGTIYAFWNAKQTRSGNTLTVVGEQWNQSLKSGESTTFGWCSNF